MCLSILIWPFLFVVGGKQTIRKKGYQRKKKWMHKVTHTASLLVSALAEVSFKKNDVAITLYD